MAPGITEPPEKGTRNGIMGSRLRRLWSRRVTTEGSSPGLKSPEAAPVVVVVETENTKAVTVVNGDEVISPSVSRAQNKDSHEHHDFDGADEEKGKEDEGDAADDTGSVAGIDAGHDSGSDSGDDTGNDTGDDSNSTNGWEASGPLPNFWEKAWSSENVGKRRQALLQGHLPKPAGSGKKPVTAASRAHSQKAVVEDVIKHTQEKMASYTARWGSSEDNKTTLSVAKSILVSAQTVKTVFDSIVQFDPTGYGSAAWTVVSLGLTLVQNDKDLMDLTFEACEYLADLMARYARIEAHYRQSQAKRDKHLERALVSVYVAILVYAAEVQESNVAKAWTRVRKSIVSLTGQPLEDLKKEIDDQKAKLEEWQRVVDRERDEKVARMIRGIQDDADELLKRIDELAKGDAKIFHGIKTEELRELWKSLRDMEGECQSKIRKSIEDEVAWWKSSGDDQWLLWSPKSKARGRKRREIARFEGSDDGGGEKSAKTDEDGSEDDDDDDQVLEKAPEDKGQGDEFGDWLFRRVEYIEWIKYPQGLLWLHGDAGCGKPALCAAIIKDLKDRFKKNNNTKKVLASWHFRSEINDTKSLNLMLVSLLRQLASKCQGFRDEKSHSAFRGYQDDGDAPTDMRDLLIHLRRFISKIDRDVFLVLDGVDQVPDCQGTRDSDRKLLDIIKSLAHKGYPNLHILVISRDEKDIRLYFEKHMQEMLVSVDVNQGLGDAINGLINKKLDGTAMTAMLKENQDLKEKISKRLRHDGQASNYIWASSVLRQVFQCRDAKEIEQALGKIPDSINARYQAALSKVSDKDKERMKRILLWLRWPERPLSQAEFLAAVDLPSPAAVTEICSRVLIETAQERVEVSGRYRMLEVFRFTHFSVPEYLDIVLAKESEATSKPAGSKIARFKPSPGEDAHLQITQRCLSILSACRLSQKTTTNATAWKTGSYTGWDHGAASDSDDASQHTGTSDEDFYASRARGGYTDSDSDRHSTSTGSSVADGGCPEAPARRYAAEYWFRHYAKIDREKIANDLRGHLDILDSEICSEMLGDANMMSFWLRTHDPDGRGAINETVPSPVYYAVKFDMKEIAMRLIAHVARLPADAKDRRVALLDQPGIGGTALQLAAHKRDSKILEELIKQQANVNSEKGRHGTAVYAAASTGDKETVVKLLRAGAKVDGEDHGYLGSPLHVAAFWGYNDIVELLLEEGNLSVDQLASPFGTALQAASAARELSTVKLLLDKGANPNFVGGSLGTAAQAAAACDLARSSLAVAVIEELRSRGAQFLDGPLFWAEAYERAMSQCAPARMFEMTLGRDTSVSEAYARVLRSGSLGPFLLGELRLSSRQDLFARALEQWTLPMAQSLELDQFSRRLVSRVPFQDQLDGIRRAVPRHEVDIHSLSHRDFIHKAYFWAGINFILGKLPHLAEACLDRVHRHLRRYGHRMNGEQATPFPVFPFRWAFEEFEDIYPSGYWNDEPYTFPRDTRVMMSYTDRSDLVAMELVQQRQRQWRRRLEEDSQPSPDKDGPENGVRQALELLAYRAGLGVWVTTDLLDLVKVLVECGDRCASYQDAAEHSTATGYREHVEELTFELFSAMFRLAVILEENSGPRTDFSKLVRPVQLLTTVRLRRIKELDAICERGLTPKHVCTNDRDEMGPGLKVNVDKMAETIAGQVEQAIGDKLAAVKGEMVSDIQRSIKEEVARLMEETRKDLEQKVRDEVQSEVARAQAVQHTLMAASSNLSI